MNILEIEYVILAPIGFLLTLSVVLFLGIRATADRTNTLYISQIDGRVGIIVEDRVRS